MSHPSSSARPTAAFMLSRPAHCIALGFGSGLSRFAPGTVGTLWAWAVFALLLRRLPDVAMAAVLVLALLLGWWACTRTAQAMHTSDPGAIVWDEVVAFWLVLWLIAPAGFAAQAVAFSLFRFFDAVKPQPVKWADQCFKGSGWRGGWGIIWDDLVAAFCTLLVIALWHHFIA